MKFDWDPEIDTPATVAVIGGGPAGVEAALYARFLGYFVMLFDVAKVGDSLLGWGEQPIAAQRQAITTWREVASSLGLAAIEAQSGPDGIPDLNAIPTYRQYVEQYLLPLARTDLLYESIHIHSPVVSVSRLGGTNSDSTDVTRRAEQEFRLLVDAKNRGEYSQLADIVLDCSGLRFGIHGLASGGGLAIGERQHASQTLAGRRDILGRETEIFAGKHILLFGNNLAACCNALDIRQLAQQAPGTRLSWIVCKQLGSSDIQFSVKESASTSHIIHKSHGLLANDDPRFAAIPAWGLEAVNHDGQQWRLRLQTTEDETLDISADAFINCSPPGADWSHTRGLRVADADRANCLTREPHYYALGQKSVGDNAQISFQEVLHQIREVFALIGGRAELDLYASIGL